MNDPAPLEDFGFNEEIVFDLTHGDCWFLAFALKQKIAGSELTAIYGQDSGDIHCIRHLAVTIPGGYVIDVEGIWEESAWLLYWFYELEHMDDVYQDGVKEDDEGYMDALEYYKNSEGMFYDGYTVSLDDIAKKITFVATEFNEDLGAA